MVCSMSYENLALRECFLPRFLRKTPIPRKFRGFPRVAEETDHPYMARVQQIGSFQANSLEIPSRWWGLFGIDRRGP